MRPLILAAGMLAVLAGCGGGGSNDSPNNIDVPLGTCDSQANINTAFWGYMNEWYYWNDRLDSSTDPRAFNSLDALLQDIKADNPDDRFSYILTKEEYQARFVDAKFFGFGLSVTLNDTSDALLVRFVYDAGGAAGIGLRRGAKITALGGKSIADAVNDGTYASGEIWGPNEENFSLLVEWQDNQGENRSDTMTKGEVATNTVFASQVLDTTAGKTGYVVFNSFLARAETDLNNALTEMSQANVDELILDLRYNGGGLVRVANQLSTQLAADSVEGKTFINYEYNSNKSAQNRAVPFDIGPGIERLNLSRLIVLTTDGTASASEMVINSLAPHIDVVVIGERTFGKPVGMNVDELCDFVIFAINFKTTNSVGFGDYFDGLPVDCPVTDAVVGDWGDNQDPLLKEAIYRLENNRCSTSATKLGANFAPASTKTNEPTTQYHELGKVH